MSGEPYRIGKLTRTRSDGSKYWSYAIVIPDGRGGRTRYAFGTTDPASPRSSASRSIGNSNGNATITSQMELPMSFKTDLYGGASLRRLRGIAPSQDRGDPMFQPVKQPGSPFVPRKPSQPVTLETLDASCGDYAAAAKAEAQWSAIGNWLAELPQGADLPNPASLSISVVEFIREADRVRLGFPNANGVPFAQPALHGLKPEVQREATAIAAETLAAWKAAGCPCLTAPMIRSIERYVKNSIRDGTAASSTAHIHNTKGK